MSERERQVMKRLKEVVDKQRDEIRAKDRELGLKNEDVEAVSDEPLPPVRPPGQWLLARGWVPCSGGSPAPLGRILRALRGGDPSQGSAGPAWDSSHGGPSAESPPEQQRDRGTGDHAGTRASPHPAEVPRPRQPWLRP